eukprot:scaffold2.g7325.t1
MLPVYRRDSGTLVSGGRDVLGPLPEAAPSPPAGPPRGPGRLKVMLGGQQRSSADRTGRSGSGLGRLGSLGSLPRAGSLGRAGFTAAGRGATRRAPPSLLLLLLLVGLAVLVWDVGAVLSHARALPDGTARRARGGGGGGGGGRRGRRELAPRRLAPHLTSLVVVACHSVYTGLDFRQAEDVSSWFLLDYQKDVPGQAHSFVEHVQLGVREAAADPSALLLFSGGKTRARAGPRAEGEGYWLIAEAARWYGHPEVRTHAFTEDHARDSLENLLFSLCRFYELTGRFPDALTLVGYDFKRDRFQRLHRQALRWPADRFSYVGTPALTEDAAEGEARTAAAFEADPYGCSEELRAKRAARDPFAVGGLGGERCPAIAELLDYCGPGVFDGELPWDGTA